MWDTSQKYVEPQNSIASVRGWQSSICLSDSVRMSSLALSTQQSNIYIYIKSKTMGGREKEETPGREKCHHN